MPDKTCQIAVITMPECEVKFWAVAFLDVLGMRDALRRMDFDPHAGLPNAERLVAAMNESMGAMERFKDFWDSFEQGQQKAKAPPLNRSVSLATVELFRQWRQVQLKHQQLGDALVLYSPLHEAADNSPVRGLYLLFAACATLFLGQLARGSAIRGGIELGAGVEHKTGGLYSAALVKAFDLESKVAKYPRIVIGDTVKKYLDWIKSRHQSIRQKADAGAAEAIQQLICVDPDDGQMIVDYLGRGFRDQIAKDHAETLVRHAHQFVREQVSHWKKLECAKLENRYRKLSSYFERRMYLW